MSARWKPIRAGIIGLWDYHQQVFSFADGRLVLRGPNGSGKTKALEVLVPFVLDGSIDARRLDPFSGQERTMRSNLLFGDRKAGHGYCWLEFGRGDERLTLGVGLRASAQSPKVDTWYFVTRGAVGVDFTLVDELRQPRTRARLEEVLPPGTVFERRTDHRQAIDRALFQLGEERYAALIELMLTLRRPQLARDLDPDALSDVLSAGLRTVDAELLTSSAQAFQDLEDVQRRLGELKRAAGAVSDLLGHWRTYLRARAGRRLDEVRGAQERLATVEARIDESERAAVNEQSAVDALQERSNDLLDDRTRAEAAIAALKDSAAYRDQGQLEDARRAAEDADREVGAAKERLDREQDRAQAAQAWGAQAAEEARRAGEAAEQARADLEQRLRLAEVEGWRGDVEALDPILVARASALQELQELVEALRATQRALVAAEAALQEARSDEEEKAGLARDAAQELDAARTQAADALRTWHEALGAPWNADVALHPLTSALDTDEGLASLGAEVRRALEPRRQHTARDRDREQQTEAEARAAAEEGERRITEIEAERDDAPTPPPHRGDPRKDRAGAPLWRLVRFGPGCPDADQAGLEGALEAAGLLDAWVSPGGDDGGGLDDTFLRPRPPAPGPSLADLLVPEEDGAVDVEHVRAILRGISVEDAGVRVQRDGSFRLGPLVGRHRPEAPRFVGATARARRRAERIAALRDDVARHRRAEGAARKRGEELDRVLADVEQAADRLPGFDALLRARRAGHRAEAVLEAARDRSQ